MIKYILVPFGEYVPLQKNPLFLSTSFVVGIGDYVHGNQRISGAETPSGAFAPLNNAMKSFSPGLVRKFYSTGGDYMVNMTNDAWFGKTSGPYQQFQHGQFSRAVENRKPVIRAAQYGNIRIY